MPLNFFFKPKELQKLPFETDIHCHLVPGVDDGSPDVETSVNLLSRMNDWGLRRIFTSPHSTLDTFENTPANIATEFGQLKQGADAAGLPMEIDHHFEYRIDSFFLDQLAAGNIKTLPGNYILLENSFVQEPWDLEQIVFDLQTKGFRPILAHPERYRYYWENNFGRYATLRQKGLLMQINLLSLADHYKGKERKVALKLLKEGLVSFIGTDLHNSAHADSIERYLRSANYRKDLKLFDRLQNDSI